MNPQLVSQRFLGPDSEVVLAGLTALLAVAAAARMLFNSLRMSALAALCPSIMTSWNTRTSTA
jgi:hypothetical protein